MKVCYSLADAKVLDALDILRQVLNDNLTRNARLAEAERKGYFIFAKGGMQIVDNVNTSFTEDDVRQLGENVVRVLRTLKEMTQPEVMNLLRNTVQVIDLDKGGKLDTSLPSLLGQMRDPNFRRGLALTRRVMRSIGAQEPRTGRYVVQSEN